jgi:indole-3-glycerol phosphate synthase
MNNKLKAILLQKQREVAILRDQLEKNPDHPIAQLLHGKQKLQRSLAFSKGLKTSTLAVIAEIKRKSPSKGLLAPITNPVDLAHHYIAGGANALSILTDKHFFDGDITDLSQVAINTRQQSIPILRKDFMIDEIQIAEAAIAGASAILCIVAVLGTKTRELIEFSHAIGLDVLVEIHDENELKIALNCGAEIIGVNNRDLNTFAVDTNRALQLITAIPDNIIKVAESGITEPALARQYHGAGFDAVLIGEALVKSANPQQFIMECRHG